MIKFSQLSVLNLGSVNYCAEAPWKQVESLKAELKQLKTEKLDLLNQMAVRSCSLCQCFVSLNLLRIINMPIKRLQGTACVCVCNRRRRRRWSDYKSASHFS